MKKLLIFLFAMAVGFTACKKDNTTPVVQKDVQFVVNQLDYENTRDDVPTCSETTPSYAKFVVDGDTIISSVFYLEGVLYTKTFKEEVGTHTLTMFNLYDSDGTLIKAAPAEGSDYQIYVNNLLDLDFDVAEFNKTKVEVDVLCYEPAFYEEFGFYWFQVNQFTVNEACMFGDFCIKSPSHYEGSLYEESNGGVEIDEPAIFELVVDGVEYSNEDWLGVGSPLCFKYVNEDGNPGEHVAELLLYAAVGDGFDYVPVYTFEWTGVFEDTYDVGEDGVYDFAVGNCVVDPDLLLAPYMNLPQDPFTMTLGTTYGPGSFGTYFDVDLEGFGPGYDLMTGWQGVWCADEDTYIYLGHTYTVTAVSSLNPPEDFTRLSEVQLAKLNYLFNHLIELSGDAGIYEDFSSYWSTIQDVTWHITNGISVSGEAAVWATDVDTNGTGFTPLPGGYAAVLFDAGENVQILFVTVDP